MPVHSGMVRRLVILSLVLSAESLSAGAPEQVSIQTLLSPQASSYQQRAVTVEGVISGLQVLPPSRGWKDCPALYGRASFVLEDDTGIIPVDVLGTRCHPDATDALPHDGDRVRIIGLVHVPKSEAPREVRILAMTIQTLESTP